MVWHVALAMALGPAWGNWSLEILQLYIIPSMHAVWVQYTVRIQSKSAQRPCKPAKECWSYVEPYLDMEV